LIAALMVLPVGGAQLIARSFAGTLRWSAAIGVGAVVAGLALSRVVGLAPGGTIVLVAGVLFAAISLVAARRSPDRALRSVALHRETESSAAAASSGGSVLGDSHSR
jgi:zinc transport system permease protein